MESKNSENCLISRSSQALVVEARIFEEFTNYLSQFPELFAQLRIRYEHKIRRVSAGTGKPRYILDLENENEEDNVMKLLFKYRNMGVPFEILTNIFKYSLTLFQQPTKVIYKPSKLLENIKACLMHYEDNADFEKFDDLSDELVKKYLEEDNLDFDVVTAVKIRQAQCALYRGNFATARRFAREAHELAGSTQFPPHFHAQACLVMGTVYRYKQKLGKTKTYLDLAKQCFEWGYSIEEFAHFYELYGSYLDRFLGVAAKLDENVKELALTSFKKMGEIGSQHSRERVSSKKQFYSMIKSVRILLDSSSSFGRKERSVSEDSVRLASNYIQTIREDLYETLPRGSKIQFQLAESDLYYRQGKFQDALKLLEKSLRDTRKFRYMTEESKILQRIEEIRNLEDRHIDILQDTPVEDERGHASCRDKETSDSELSDVFSGSKYL